MTIAPSEGNWRQNAQSIRSQLETGRRRIASLEAAVANDERTPGEREVSQKALLTARRSVADIEQRWEEFEKSAATLNIPQSWIEPIPALTNRNPQ
jgi:BMFP domain-containing protein YqiC